ncbi:MULTISPECIES: glycosyltransferase family 2 protein [unclassified Paenibacillus]|uniref:glycosyltransferase n=1 Tax=unclassified Paenibacillus TaxID=185978 RepID=UPI001AE3D4B7|nr:MULTISPECIES: glycosyltransferase family 2 protein [unclassified Paenibacillus]MBP1157211.1 glycosyltransferase involved in cell wall biosynthesis [Paenibacillus sp. PvP091]MBP1172050.1 glycosyltransferase involved in cell wall biosynthesis [Paenibacillus sp. PvR098]MBP2438431.1 glycosyltransferase involved in cell wall biosynthesis [Paenibacillus sp. PvP052]
MRIIEVWALAALGYWLFMLWDTIRARKWMSTLPRSAGNHGFNIEKSSGRGNRGNPTEHTASAFKGAVSASPDTPLVSVIIAAKEEESSIADTVKHLLNQTYPKLEIIAVNDRSQDATGHRLDELRRWSESRDGITVPLRVIHITSLPPGWLGKNHALYQGYLQARGKYLLFTDADVQFDPNTVADAVRYLQEQHADHLTLAPRIIARGFWLKAFVQYFFFTLCLFIRPWRVNDDLQHRHGMGVGAFNLLTRRAYERIGTHKAIAMRPDDDLQLGKQVKRARLRQRLASGAHHISVEWYRSLRDAVQGLEKNIFSGFSYRISIAVLGVIGQLALFLFPFAGVVLASGWAAAGFGASLLLMLTVYFLLIRSIVGKGGTEVLALPVSIALLCYIVVRSVWLTIRQGGIYWRGTFYSLKELRRMQDPNL